VRACCQLTIALHVLAHPLLAEPVPDDPDAKASAPSSATATEIRLTIASSPEQRELIGEVARELLARLEVQVRVIAVEQLDVREIVSAAREDVLGSAWIDMRGEDSVAFFFADGAKQRILIRSLPKSERSAEVLREQLAAILLSSVETLLSGGQVGAPRADAVRTLGVRFEPEPEPAPQTKPDPAPNPPAKPEKPARPKPSNTEAAPFPRFEPGLYYALERLAQDPTLNHGLGLAGSLRFERTSLGLSLLPNLPVTVERDGVALSAFEAAAFARGALVLFAPGAQRLEIELDAGVRFTRFAAERSGTEGATAQLSGAQSRFDPAVGWFVSGAQLLRSRLYVHLDLGLVVSAERPKYVVAREDGVRQTLLEPAAVRPSLRIGLRGF